MIIRKNKSPGSWLQAFFSSGNGLLIFFIIFMDTGSVLSSSESLSGNRLIAYHSFHFHKSVKDTSMVLQKLNQEVETHLLNGDSDRTKECVNKLYKVISNNPLNTLSLSDSYYYIGLYHLIWGGYADAIKWLKRSMISREILGIDDMRYAKCLYNLGVAYNKAGDYGNQKYFTLKSLEIEKKHVGESDSSLLTSYATMINALISLKDYNEAVLYGDLAQKIIQDNKLANSEMADIYTNLGACYSKLSDFSKATIYFEKSESLYRTRNIPKDERYLNIIHNLALTYGYFGYIDKSDKYFKQGLELAKSFNTMLSFNFINSYAKHLAKSGKTDSGKKLLEEAVLNSEHIYGLSSINYYVVLCNYADFLLTSVGEIKKSILLFEECMCFINNYDNNLSFKEQIYVGYANSLTANGEFDKALAVLQELLNAGTFMSTGGLTIDNPDINDLIPDYRTLNILKTKHLALGGLYKNTNELKYLLASAQTIELIIAILEKIRLNISEEESRLILGNRYRDYYLHAIKDYDRCFTITGDKNYLDKAFLYFEKSKGASLLASVRELKATQLQIPHETALLEKKLQNEISLYNAVISSEKAGANPNESMIEEWNENLFRATQRRDSLISVFEERFPEYYMVKYNTDVLNPDEITNVVGRNSNYLNYIVADSFLSVFVVNRKYKKIITLAIDSAFFNTIEQFRNLITLPSIDNNARKDFNNFRNSGHYLYEKLIAPVKQFLVSDKLIISPDNTLSNIPFEVIPLPGNETEGDIFYRNLRYIMDDYRISYAYSATLMAETGNFHSGIFNKTISFAPAYDNNLIIDSLTNPSRKEILRIKALPYAREEARFISAITNGILYEGADALESVFKKKADKYDIVHLAMHTLLNDRYPMHSKMIFSPEPDGSEDGFLKTYEIYGIPFKAKMVVLSSCNSGSGYLHEGEGILSLARGFAYSGSKSTVLSMWEIEDRSGAEIMKKFYCYIKKGYSKSNALKKARVSFLKNADQFRSHPYFWSAYVIYGDNSPVYPPYCLILIIASAILLGVYFIIRYSWPK
ncbi:MAG: CHAT domain-containing protein [Bacteroidales bacterium]|jgi:CHAT domain-containing protein/Tfp pilus assembly protein PilF